MSVSKEVLDIDRKVAVDNQQAAEEIQHPPEHYDPISGDLMTDPVVIADGFTYDRKTVETWFAQGKKKSLQMHSELSSMNIFPNNTLKSIIKEFPSKALKEKKQTEEKNRQFLENEKLKSEALLQKALQDQKVALEQQQQRALQKALQDQAVAFQQQQQRALQELVQQHQRALQASERQHRDDLQKALAKQQAEPQQRLDDLIHSNTDSKSKMEPYANGHQRPNPVTTAYANHKAAAGASIVSSSLLPVAAATPEDDGGDALDALAQQAGAASASASFKVDSLDSGDFKKSAPVDAKPKSLDSDAFAGTPPFASAKPNSENDASDYRL